MIDSRTSVAPGGQQSRASNPFLRSDQLISAKTLPVGRSAETIIHELDSNFSSSDAFDQVVSKVVQTVLKNSKCLTLCLAERDDHGQFNRYKSLIDSTAEDVNAVLAEDLSVLTHQVQESNGLRTQCVTFGKARLLIGTPIRIKPKLSAPVELILVGCFDIEQRNQSDLTWLMSCATQQINTWISSRTLTQMEQERRQRQELASLFAELDQSESVGQAARIIVNRLRQMANAVQVAIAIDEKLIAVSDVEQIDLQSEANQLTQAACNAGIHAGQAMAFSPSQDSLTAQQLPLQAFCRMFQFESCVSLPLLVTSKVSNQRVSASILIASSEKKQSSTDYLQRLEQIAKPLANHLNVIVKANRSLRAIAKSRFLDLIQHRWRKAVMVALTSLAILLAVPMPYRIKCDCEIQPVMRRVVVAPFDSVLERTLAKNGDVVSKDQVIARLDGRVLRIELSGLEAELAGARKRYDSELAGGNIALSQIAKSEIERLKAKIEMLEKRASVLEIRSPIDGVVIHGDLEKVEGASLTIGQPLFEIAPLDQMVVEVAIPEHEILHVEPNLDVALKLSAFPFQTWQGKIESIHPRTEIIENKSVFVAQATIANSDNVLRPGMKGKAKIRSKWAPLGWNLFHHPWETVRYWTIW